MLGLYSLAVLALTLFCLLRHRFHKHFFYHPLPKEGPSGQHAEEAGAAAPRRLYPHLDPLFGLDLTVATWRDFHRGELAKGARRRHARHGPTFVAPGHNNTIHTIEPANIRAVTTHAFAAFGKAAWAAEAAKHVGHGVLLNEGAAWRRSRALLKPIFHNGNRGVAALDEPALLEPHVRRLVDKMRVLSSAAAAAAAATGNKKGKGKPGEATAMRSGVFDSHELASMFTLDVVTEFLFGKSTSCLAADDPRLQDGPHDGVRFLALVKAFEGPSAEFIAVGPLAWLRLAPSYRRLTGVVDGMKAFFKNKLDDIIQEETTTTTSSQSQQQPQPQGWQSSPSVFRAMKAAGASVEQIQGEVQNLFFASYDTTSAFLANVMYVLVRHPRVQLRLRREISEVLEGRPPTKQDLAKLEYLRLFLMEALRLYSPVTSHSRTARVDTVLPRGGGADGQQPLAVRAGATVTWSTYALNRDPRWYGPDWAAFRPERWQASGSNNGGGGALKKARHLHPTTTNGPSTTTTTTTSPPAEECKGKDSTLVGDVGDTTDGARDPHDDVVVGPPTRWRDFFMPFGSGPRSCLGQQMVQSEVAYVVVRLLQEFQAIRADRGGVDDDGNEPSRPTIWKEAKAVSFVCAGGVLISVE